MLLQEINIGAVSFDLHGSDQVILPRVEPAYADFSGKSTEPYAFASRVELRIDSMPSTAGLQKIYDNNESWFMLRKEKQRWIIHHATRDGIPYWLAILESGSTNITVYCSPAMMEDSGRKALLTNPFSYPLDLLSMMYLLSEHRGVILHAAGISCEGKGLIFPGVSGTGKSTFLSHFAADNPAVKLSDDRIVTRKCLDNRFRIFGTPWLGNAGISANASAPFSAMYFIKHGPANRIIPVGKAEALKRLMPVISIPWYDREVMEAILDFLGEIVKAVPAFELQCTADIQASEAVLEHSRTKL